MVQINLLEEMLEEKIKGDFENPLRRIKAEFKGLDFTFEIEIPKKKVISFNGKIFNLIYPESLLVSNLSEEQFKTFLRLPNLSSNRYHRNNVCQSVNGMDFYRQYLCCNGCSQSNVIGVSFISEKHKLIQIADKDKIIYLL